MKTLSIIFTAGQVVLWIIFGITNQTLQPSTIAYAIALLFFYKLVHLFED